LVGQQREEIAVSVKVERLSRDRPSDPETIGDVESIVHA
jgi:hypothetical protein